MGYPPEYIAARDHFQVGADLAAPHIAEGIAQVLVEVEKAPLAGDLLGPTDETARVREFGRVMQVADEICESMGWDAVHFQVLIEACQYEINERNA